MELTAAQTDKLRQKTWYFSNPCEVCHMTNWALHPRIYEIREFNGGNFVMDGPLIPFVVIQCNTCGNMRYINAIAAGIVNQTGGPV
jgi:hypothetical protein